MRSILKGKESGIKEVVKMSSEPMEIDMCG
jgi:hypothetical protein